MAKLAMDMKKVLVTQYYCESVGPGPVGHATGRYWKGALCMEAPLALDEHGGKVARFAVAPTVIQNILGGGTYEIDPVSAPTPNGNVSVDRCVAARCATCNGWIRMRRL
jgi:hypothetical protein